MAINTAQLKCHGFSHSLLMIVLLEISTVSGFNSWACLTFFVSSRIAAANRPWERAEPTRSRGEPRGNCCEGKGLGRACQQGSISSRVVISDDSARLRGKKSAF